jgi:hypothetical protein
MEVLKWVLTRVQEVHHATHSSDSESESYDVRRITSRDPNPTKSDINLLDDSSQGQETGLSWFTDLPYTIHTRVLPAKLFITQTRQCRFDLKAIR